MFTIENQQLKVSIHPKGAELQSIFHKDHRLEYMWNGDPAVWGKHSPILFPMVGTLKGGQYHYKGKIYQLGRHGFARDRVFVVEMQKPDAITFLLRSDAETRASYPFDFELRVSYELLENGLRTGYSVNNPSGEDLYFSIGAHPAFKVPLLEGMDYSDHYLEFEKAETIARWPISADGLIERKPLPVLNGSRRLPLSKELFANDALVFKHPASHAIALRSDKSPHGLRMAFPGFPFLGLWAAKNADFVCIEPWCGIADGVDSHQEWTEKEGINRLAPGETFGRAWTLDIF